ncbi:hypothetical protein [Caulobacter soli]|uniref:hypothetical protein n=1 Tax=Caulobacter soli TaxID=2708539 RepID=UPI0013EDF2FA|nr:hypothetical protein [Caulobacter soli]
MNQILTESLTPGGTRPLAFRQMLDVLEAGHAAGLCLFTVDVVAEDGKRPLPEWMFRLTDEEVETLAIDKIVPMALEFYGQHASDPELNAAWFEVFFEKLD